MNLKLTETSSDLNKEQKCLTQVVQYCPKKIMCLTEFSLGLQCAVQFRKEEKKHDKK